MKNLVHKLLPICAAFALSGMALAQVEVGAAAIKDPPRGIAILKVMDTVLDEMGLPGDQMIRVQAIIKQFKEDRKELAKQMRSSYTDAEKDSVRARGRVLDKGFKERLLGALNEGQQQTFIEDYRIEVERIIKKREAARGAGGAPPPMN